MELDNKTQALIRKQFNEKIAALEAEVKDLGNRHISQSDALDELREQRNILFKVLGIRREEDNRPAGFIQNYAFRFPSRDGTGRGHEVTWAHDKTGCNCEASEFGKTCWARKEVEANHGILVPYGSRDGKRAVRANNGVEGERVLFGSRWVTGFPETKVDDDFGRLA